MEISGKLRKLGLERLIKGNIHKLRNDNDGEGSQWNSSGISLREGRVNEKSRKILFRHYVICENPPKQRYLHNKVRMEEFYRPLHHECTHRRICRACRE